MDGYVAKLPEICDLAERYGAFVMVDDCHAHGHLGERGRGTPALTGAGERVQIVTGTFGKTLGGGDGRLHRRAAAGHRHAAPARAALSLLQLARARRSPPAR